MSNLCKVLTSAPDITVALEGKVDASNYELIQEETLNLISEQKAETFTFDVNDVSYVSSAGLRMFSAINKACKANGLSYKLVGLRPDIMKMFQLTGYASVFKIEIKEE